MARSVKEKEYAGKRNEILDVAQRLVYTRGYEEMSIQDILDDLHISKGAFYHYFDSRQDLLEGMIDRMSEEVERLVTPIVHDPHLPALDKLQRFFASLAYFKTERKTFLLALLQVWYKDENAIVREKVRKDGNKLIIPMLTLIIHQGIREGVFKTPFPDSAGEIVMSMTQGLQETLVELILSQASNPDAFQQTENIVAAYADAFEHVLGIPTGSFSFVDTLALREWFVSSKE